MVQPGMVCTFSTNSNPHHDQGGPTEQHGIFIMHMICRYIHKPQSMLSENCPPCKPKRTEAEHDTVNRACPCSPSSKQRVLWPEGRRAVVPACEERGGIDPGIAATAAVILPLLPPGCPLRHVPWCWQPPHHCVDRHPAPQLAPHKQQGVAGGIGHGDRCVAGRVQGLGHLTP